FGPEELVARIRVALRRVSASDAPPAGRLQAGELTIDYDRRRVVRGDDEIRLTPKEFELLSLLAEHADRVLTHQAILKAIWGANAVDQPEHLWVLIAQLRKKIEPDPGNPRYLISEPFVGYRLVSTPDRSQEERPSAFESRSHRSRIALAAGVHADVARRGDGARRARPASLLCGRNYRGRGGAVGCVVGARGVV